MASLDPTVAALVTGFGFAVATLTALKPGSNFATAIAIVICLIFVSSTIDFAIVTSSVKSISTSLLFISPSTTS